MKLFGRIHPLAILALCMLVAWTVLPLPQAMGAGARTASLTSGEGHRGDTVRVSLGISDVKDIAGVETTIAYDATRLTTTSESINRAAILKDFLSDRNVLADTGSLKFSAASSGKIAQAGDAVLLTVDFVIKADAPPGKAFVNLSHLLVTDGEGNLETAPMDGGITVLDSGGSGTGPVGGSGTTPGTTTEDIAAVVDTGDGMNVSAVTIRRTTSADGTKKDAVAFTLDQAQETVTKAKAAGKSAARIVIPDAKNEVSQLDLTVPKAAADELARGGLSLEIDTVNGKLVIPSDAFKDVTEDLYFRFVPIKNEAQRAEIAERAVGAQIVKAAAGGNAIKLIARPLTIETNLANRAVSIVLPLTNADLPTDARARDDYLADLTVFVEHGDGDLELAKPEVAAYKDGQPGLRFGIDKFSTFSILDIGASGAARRHDAYMQGYPDGNFKPDKAISRAEMAVILSRVGAGAPVAGGQELAFADVASGHWASTAIGSAGAKGLMTGFPDGTFKPDRFMTRAEMATVVSHWLDLQGETTSTFPDTAGHWARQDIALVRQAGIINGFPDGNFKPEQALTRAETVAIINRILNRGALGWTTSSWKDVPTTHWAFQDIEEASVSHAFATDAKGSEVVTQP
ncbi:S-layer homology domain-containing protein [Paenibacillus glycinis]|uniref:SLH domain-containing protein n=1 Tax=Paenibacillus glycinis TaxID=2697035 RepID=A0ABW9XXM5_9BACL|nr:S-layer homology domain-containing protein [Paenibacillus glycinis]NBD27370.1 hypothetical protein [Paenibacillus glycinis]